MADPLDRPAGGELWSRLSSVKAAGILGVIGGALTLAAGVYLVLIHGYATGLGLGLSRGAIHAPAAIVGGMPSIVPGLAMIGAAAAALPFASVLIVGRGVRPSAIVLTVSGLVACVAQAVFAANMDDVERVLISLLQPGALVAVSGLIALTGTRDRQTPQST